MINKYIVLLMATTIFSFFLPSYIYFQSIFSWIQSVNSLSHWPVTPEANRPTTVWPLSSCLLQQTSPSDQEQLAVPSDSCLPGERSCSCDVLRTSSNLKENNKAQLSHCQSLGALQHWHQARDLQCDAGGCQASTGWLGEGGGVLLLLCQGQMYLAPLLCSSTGAAKARGEDQ